MGEQAGLRVTMPLSRLVGVVVYIFGFVPALITAPNALRIEAIPVPATEMRGAFMAAIPSVFGAGIIAAVAVALSFGLGGREAAGRQMERWPNRQRGQSPRK